MANLSIGVLASNIEGWHEARNLIDGSTDQAQFVKLMEEAGELAGNIARGKDVRDDIGDMVVVLINIARRNGYKLEDCMQVAWDDIKDRKGKMVDGVFIKEADLHPARHLSAPLTFRNLYGQDAPENATHMTSNGTYLKQGTDDKFWRIYSDGAWRVMSGEPVGELTDLRNK